MCNACVNSYMNMKALKLTIAIIAGKSMAYSYIVLYFYSNKKKLTRAGV